LLNYTGKLPTAFVGRFTQFYVGYSLAESEEYHGKCMIVGENCLINAVEKICICNLPCQTIILVDAFRSFNKISQPLFVIFSDS
jgi:hypothetical protein